jgi:RHH-type rel operon transcriptional repressor/antitoxin RelB
MEDNRMLVINVPADIEERLTDLAAKAERTPEEIVGEALLTYLEDLEDAFIAIDRLKSARRRIPLEEVMRKYEGGASSIDAGLARRVTDGSERDLWKLTAQDRSRI